MSGQRKAAPALTESQELGYIEKLKLEEPRFVHDFIGLRSADKQGRSAHSHVPGGFQWPLEAGGMAYADDWEPTPECGHGLHLLADGLGDWGLMAAPASQENLWYVCGAIRAEAVEIDGKIKVPRCRVLYAGDFAGAVQLISPAMTTAIQRLVRERTAAAKPEGEKASGASGAATASGDGGAATASGDGGAATASGASGAATASGASGAATASGYSGAATASGEACVAIATGGGRARVALGCLLVLVERDDHGKIIHHFASMAGENGVTPNRWYTLRTGVLVDVTEE